MPQNDIILETLKGGLNEDDAPNAIAPDECSVANNVEYFLSTLGERRLGGERVGWGDVPVAATEIVVFLTRHFPTPNELDNELWAFVAVIGTSIRAARRFNGIWTEIDITAYPIVSTAPDVYSMAAASFDGNLYICAKFVDGSDRLLVWDGTSIRLAGLAEPAMPTVANEGSGTVAIVRYYRVRYAIINAGKILLMSEPSDQVEFTPSGSGAGARLTKPASINENETTWIVEASRDPNGFFYQIAKVPVGTTTYDDTTADTTSYADEGDLSPAIGEYIPLPNAKYITVEDDRIVLGGSFIDDAFASTVQWTPTRNAVGYGNSERIPADIDSSLDLDSNEGGGLLGVSQGVEGTFYAFKYGRTYMMTRTGDSSNAYTPLTLSKARGAVQGSIVSAMDELGRPCVFFLDPHIGPSRVGATGVQQIRGLRKTWGRFNASAQNVAARGVYYPYKQQVWWVIAVNGAASPNYGLKLQVDLLKSALGGVRGGWTTFDGLMPTAVSATPYTEIIINDDGIPFVNTRPILGYSAGYTLRCDITDLDDETRYIARIRTKAFFPAGMLQMYGIRVASLLAGALAKADVQVSLIRDYGKEKNHVIVPLDPSPANEEYLIKQLDNLVMSESYALQIEFSDVEDVRNVTRQLYLVESD